MTLNLKLVRHHDGKWTALTPESDDLTEVSVKERKCAPIDPACLLKALDSVLSSDCGIKDIGDVPRVASLMKKFSKKLVSRCVYCNVLQATKPDILSEFLEKGGWETINVWLQYTKASSSSSFLIELLKLCKLLPMTLDRLKENNTAKLVKSLTKHENNEVKTLSSELVNKWMSIIKVKKAGETANVEKKKKKEKPEKAEKVVEPPKEDVKPITESPKTSLRLKGLKRTSTEQEPKKQEIYEDVKIDPEPLLPVSKKPRADRPKTVKIYQKKFRATGLEEETPLPKDIKKNTKIDKTAAVAAAKNTLKLNSSMSLERITEKKIKPESLMAINESTNTKGIKLIPAKPRPTYVLHESASFMDALISQPPPQPVKKKKKHKANTTASSPNAHSSSSPNHSASSPNTTSSPTSPTITPPKFQFYKDTLEMSEEGVKKEVKEEEISPKEEPSENKESEPEPMDTTEEGGHTPPNDETTNTSTDLEPKVEEEMLPFDPNNLRSIMSHGRRRSKKKSVRWVEDENIKEVRFFEMDETERVNVSRNSSFYDLKSIEMKREREAMEMAKRQSGEEYGRWWAVPILIDLPPSPIEPGCNSVEKQNEIARQQATLQEIYFTKEMIPDSPHEPDLEIHPPKEPIIIPFDENNVISTVLDYSNYKLPPQLPASLPDILSSLMKHNMITTGPLPNLEQPAPQIPVDTVPVVTEPPPMPGPETVLSTPPPNGFLCPPLQFNGPPPPEGMPMQMPVDWRGPPPEIPTMPLDPFYAGFPMNQNIPPNQFPPPPQGGNIRLPVGPNIRPSFRGGPPPRMGNIHPPRRRKQIVCRHFTANHCRFGITCTFLHPGVNGPPL